MSLIIAIVIVAVGVPLIAFSKTQYARQQQAIADYIDSPPSGITNRTNLALNQMGDDFDNITLGEN